eukprot:14191-Heterococcus_DN1.PRE.2
MQRIVYYTVISSQCVLVAPSLHIEYSSVHHMSLLTVQVTRVLSIQYTLKPSVQRRYSNFFVDTGTVLHFDATVQAHTNTATAHQLVMNAVAVQRRTSVHVLGSQLLYIDAFYPVVKTTIA